MSNDILNRDIQIKQAEQIVSKADKPTMFPAKLVAVGGSVTPNNQPNAVYFKTYGNEHGAVGTAWNTRVKPYPGLAVWISNSPTVEYRLEVIGLYDNDSLDAVNIGQFNTPAHGYSHEYISETDFGSDVVRTYLPAVQPLKTLHNGLTFITQPYTYSWFGVALQFPGVADTVTVSGAGNVRYVLLVLDPGSNTIRKLEGAEVLDNGVIPVPLPTIPVDTIPTAYLKVDDTTVLETLDLRQLFAVPNSQPYTPNKDGDILIGNNGIFESKQPLVDSFGEIITVGGEILTI